MSLQFGTVKSISAPHIRKPQPSRPPLTAEQREDKQKVHEEREARINAKVQEWVSYTLNLAEELGKEFERKPRYFLDLFFQNGARLVRGKNKVNAFNAFKSLKANEINTDATPGNAFDLMEIQKDYLEEYEKLSPKEREEMVETFKLTRDDYLKVKRPSAKGRIQCISNGVQNMQKIITSLKLQVGVEGFFCIVRSSSEVFLRPQWFFTSPELEEYMAIAVRPSWVTEQVGAKIEAFAVAGCDVSMLCRNSKQKAQYLKTEIRILIKEALVEASGDQKATMNYTHYEEEVIHRYGVVMEGWTADKFVNPSELSSSLPLLTKLRDALKNGSCHFRKLSAAEKQQRMKEYGDKVASGEIPRWERERRSDLGTKRKKKTVLPGNNALPTAPVEDAPQSDPEEVDGPPPHTPLPSHCHITEQMPSSPAHPTSLTSQLPHVIGPVPEAVHGPDHYMSPVSQFPTLSRSWPALSAGPSSSSLPTIADLQPSMQPSVSAGTTIDTLADITGTSDGQVLGKRKRVPTKQQHIGFIDPNLKSKRKKSNTKENSNPVQVAASG